MCQATGYKLTSNKELPSANQKYSQLIQSEIEKTKEYAPTKKKKATQTVKAIRMFSILSIPFCFKVVLSIAFTKSKAHD